MPGRADPATVRATGGGDNARKLSAADIVDGSRDELAGSVWGGGWKQCELVGKSRRRRRRAGEGSRHIRRPSASPSVNGILGRVQPAIAPHSIALRQLQRRAGGVFASSMRSADDALVQGHDGDPDVRRGSGLSQSTEVARTALGLRGRRIVTLLGYIHGRK